MCVVSLHFCTACSASMCYFTFLLIDGSANVSQLASKKKSTPNPLAQTFSQEHSNTSFHFCIWLTLQGLSWESWQCNQTRLSSSSTSSFRPVFRLFVIESTPVFLIVCGGLHEDCNKLCTPINVLTIWTSCWQLCLSSCSASLVWLGIMAVCFSCLFSRH